MEGNLAGTEAKRKEKKKITLIVGKKGKKRNLLYSVTARCPTYKKEGGKRKEKKENRGEKRNSYSIADQAHKARGGGRLSYLKRGEKMEFADSTLALYLKLL